MKLGSKGCSNCCQCACVSVNARVGDVGVFSVSPNMEHGAVRQTVAIVRV